MSDITRYSAAGFLESGSGRRAEETARSQFLHLTMEVCPQVWTDLRDLVLPAFILDPLKTPRARTAFISRLRHEPIRDRLPDPVKYRLTASFEGWAIRYNVAGCSWFLDRALSTLHYWTLHPGLASKAQLVFTAREYGEIPTLTIDPSRMSHAQQIAALDEHRAQMLGRGHKEIAKDLRRRDLEWAALYQIAGWKIEQIIDWSRARGTLSSPVKTERSKTAGQSLLDPAGTIRAGYRGALKALGIPQRDGRGNKGRK